MRAGLWSCKACAFEHALPWGSGQASAPKGWCGMTQHRVATRLEWMPGAEPAISVHEYVFPTSVPAAPTADASVSAAGEVSVAPHRPTPSSQPQQGELF